MPRAQREQQILEVAGEVFARHGYHSTSMDEIARRADVSKPMLYAYFHSKEGLYVAYIERTGQELVARLRRALDDGQDPPVQPISRVEEFLCFVEEHRDGWRVLFSEASTSGPVAAEVAALRRRITEAVRALVQAGLPPGVSLPDPVADAVAHAIVGTGESLANWWLEHPEVSREELASWYGGMVRATTAAVLRR
jgi:AcrR family transcriptional regulator